MVRDFIGEVDRGVMQEKMWQKRSVLMQRIGGLFFLWMVVHMVGACDDTDSKEGVFTESVVTQASDVLERKALGETYIYTQNAVAETRLVGRPLHMIWVIDNSPSMADENKMVREGVMDLFYGLQQHSKSVQATIISRKRDPQLEQLGLEWYPERFAGTGVHFIDFQVESVNQIHVLARYLSPSLKFFRKHGFEYNPETQGKRLQPLSSHPIAGFFRHSKALKVFVVVTDDGEGLTVKPGKLDAFKRAKETARVGERDGEKTQAMPAAYVSEASESFISLLNELYNGELSLFRFFGFLDLKSAAINREKGHGGFFNTSYKNLQQQLGGQLWHIKDLSPQQWTHSVFSAAQRRLISLVNAQFYGLDYPAVKIQKVTVAGKVLPRNAYALHGEHSVEIKRELEDGDAITITYESYRRKRL